MKAAVRRTDNTRVIIGIVLAMTAIRIAMKLGERLFEMDLNDSLWIFGLACATFVLFQALANRKVFTKPNGSVISLLGFTVTILFTIGLCGLARILPFLRS